MTMMMMMLDVILLKIMKQITGETLAVRSAAKRKPGQNYLCINQHQLTSNSINLHSNLNGLSEN